MSRPVVLIELSPSRLELAVVHRGEVTSGRVLRSAQADWGSSWPEYAPELGRTLRLWVAELGLSSHPCTLVYHAPTTATGVFPCPAAAGPEGVIGNATLALAAHAGYDVANGPLGTIRLTTDRQPAPPSATSPAPARQAHTLATADQDVTATTLSELLIDAGLKPERLVPASALMLAHAVSTVSRATACACVVWMGDHEAIIAAGDRERLRFVRLLSIGCESLADALVRAGAVRLPDGSRREVDRPIARELLASAGVPGPGDTTPGEGAPPLRAVLMPVLQRLGTEIKQSIRFGLPEEERAGLSIVLQGPGSALPGLDAALAACSALTISSGGASPDPMSASQGPLRLVLQGVAPTLDLSPQSTVHVRTLGRIRRAVWAGAGVALALIAAQAVWTNSQLADSRAHAARTRQSSDTAEQATALKVMVTSAQRARSELDTRLQGLIGNATDWSTILAMLARNTPAELRLSGIEGSPGDRGPVLRLVGIATPGPGRKFDPARGSDQIRAYAESLRQLPVVSSLRMGGTSRVPTAGGEGLQFDLTLELVGVPADQIAAVPEPNR